MDKPPLLAGAFSRALAPLLERSPKLLCPTTALHASHPMLLPSPGPHSRRPRTAFMCHSHRSFVLHPASKAPIRFFSNSIHIVLALFLLVLLVFPYSSLTMASRMANLWRSIASPRRFTTSTAPKMKAFAPTANNFLGRELASKPIGEFVPVYVALGLITLSASFGLYTANHELRYAPNVLVSKKRRETVPEVEDPDWAAEEGDRFRRKSLFRKVSHLARATITDPTLPAH